MWGLVAIPFSMAADDTNRDEPVRHEWADHGVDTFPHTDRSDSPVM